MSNDFQKTVIKFSNAFGPSGMEEEVQSIVKEHFTIETDTIQNTFVFLNEKEGLPTLFLDAHADEVGFMVQSILENGRLSFLPIGGWDPSNIVSCPVKIKTKKGFVSGIVASIPPHFMREDQKGRKIDFDDLVIDVGTSYKEESIALGIEPGDFIVPDVQCDYIPSLQVFKGKAFDCRIGCAALFETLKILENKELPVNVIGLFSAQEEVGERGIECALQKIHPQLAICFEGCPSDDTFEAKDKIQSAMAKGVMLRAMDRSMITHPKWQRYALETAKKYDIPYQVAVRKGGGTNGGILHVHDIPTIVIGIPVRYAHASVGFCSEKDLEGAIELACQIALSLDRKALQALGVLPD